jgi:hypothetical protein
MALLTMLCRAALQFASAQDQTVAECSRKAHKLSNLGPSSPDSREEGHGNYFPVYEPLGHGGCLFYRLSFRHCRKNLCEREEYMNPCLMVVVLLLLPALMSAQAAKAVITSPKRNKGGYRMKARFLIIALLVLPLAFPAILLQAETTDEAGQPLRWSNQRGWVSADSGQATLCSGEAEQEVCAVIDEI